MRCDESAEVHRGEGRDVEANQANGLSQLNLSLAASMTLRYWLILAGGVETRTHLVGKVACLAL